MNYDLALGNGGMDDADLDENTGYTLGTRVGLRPNAISGLEVGVSMRLTRIHSGQLAMSSDGDMDMGGMDMSGTRQTSMAASSASAVAGGGSDDDTSFVNETIIVGYVAYLEYPVHLIAEVYSIDHTMDEYMGGETTLLGYWGQLGWSFGQITPYIRYEAFNLDLGDMLYAKVNAPEAWSMVRGGVNFGVHEQIAIKVEGGHDLESAVTDFRTQLAVGF